MQVSGSLQSGAAAPDNPPAEVSDTHAGQRVGAEARLRRSAEKELVVLLVGG
jgi:hypothetical protein